MIRIRRRNTAWLAVLALLTTIGLVTATSAPIVQFLLVTMFAFATLASVVEIGKERESLISALRRAPIRNRVSAQAKEASERARSRGGFVNDNLILMDLGLIAVQSSYEGMAMRRTRNVSKDDDGARPFVTLNVDPSEAERNATVRFEIYNQHGEQKFIHELRAYLREGEMSIMTDHHLPLAGNQDVQGAGDWDLRVYVDGNLVGMHSFMLTPSMTERQRRLAAEEDVDMGVYQVVDEVKQEITPRLQDLLQSQRQQAYNSSSSGSSRSSSSSSQSNEVEESAEPSRSRSRSRRR